MLSVQFFFVPKKSTTLCYQEYAVEIFKAVTTLLYLYLLHNPQAPSHRYGLLVSSFYQGGHTPKAEKKKREKERDSNLLQSILSKNLHLNFNRLFSPLFSVYFLDESRNGEVHYVMRRFD